MTEIDEMPKFGRESAICELRCRACSEGMRFTQRECSVCGWINPRYGGLVLPKEEVKE